jgi:hypothetical protein
MSKNKNRNKNKYKNFIKRLQNICENYNKINYTYDIFKSKIKPYNGQYIIYTIYSWKYLFLFI